MTTIAYRAQNLASNGASLQLFCVHHVDLVRTALKSRGKQENVSLFWWMVSWVDWCKPDGTNATISNRTAQKSQEWEEEVRKESQVSYWPVSEAGTMSGPKQGGRQDIERPDDTWFGEASRARLSANMSSSIRLMRVREGKQDA